MLAGVTLLILIMTSGFTIGECRKYVTVCSRTVSKRCQADVMSSCSWQSEFFLKSQLLTRSAPCCIMWLPLQSAPRFLHGGSGPTGSARFPGG